jgi:hypothetical protein
MSGLLQRLAGQALGAKAAGTAPRIRPATNVHPQAPVALPTRAETPGAGVQTWRDANAAPERAPIDAASPASTATPARSRTEPETQEIAPLRIEIPAASQPRVHSGQDRAQDAAVPLRLLDEAAPAPGSPPAIAPLAIQPRPLPQSALGGDRSEPAEVHVHIGRIEVTAVTEPERPKKARPATPRQTMPLADYLARRRRS